MENSKPEKPKFRTPSEIELETFYRPSESSGDHAQDQQSYPGEYPFTRGIYPTQYRSRLWTMRQYAGYGTAVETNVAASEARLSDDVIEKLRSRLGDYNFYQRHSIKI